MEEEKLSEKAKELREKAIEKKKKETEAQTKNRMRTVLSDRDAAMRAVYDYQDQTGIPTLEEAEKNFFDVEAKEKDEQIS